MTDQSKGSLFSAPTPGQAPKASPDKPAEPVQASETPTTDLNALFKEIKDLKASLPTMIQTGYQEVVRGEQSARDKQTAQIQKEFEKAVKVYQAATGQQPTQEQAVKLRDVAAANVQAEIQQQPNSEAPSPEQAGQPNHGGAPQEEEAPAWKLQMLQSLSAKHDKLTLEKGDPEADSFQDSDDPIELAQRIDAALTSKANRVKGEAAARLPFAPASGAPGNPIANITDPATLFRMAQEKVSRQQRR